MTSSTSTVTSATRDEKGTAYIVLLHDSEKGWVEVANRSRAASADAAIRQVADKNGAYVAVPYRSWKPVKVTVSTETVVKLGASAG